MEEYQMELLTLNKFIINGQLCERGIIQFLANGQLGDFDINVKKTNNQKSSEISYQYQSLLITYGLTENYIEKLIISFNIMYFKPTVRI